MRTCAAPTTTTEGEGDVKRKVLLVWLVAMLLAVVVAVWRAESQRSTEPVQLGLVDGGAELHLSRLATTIEALKEGHSIEQQGGLVELGGQQMDPIQRPRVRAVRRTARGPPECTSSAMCVNEDPDQ
jgi:hypothetical protein